MQGGVGAADDPLIFDIGDESHLPSLRVSAFASHSLTGEAFVHRWSGIGRSNSAGVALSFNLPIWSYDGGELNAARTLRPSRRNRRSPTQTRPRNGRTTKSRRK